MCFQRLNLLKISYFQKIKDLFMVSLEIIQWMQIEVEGTFEITVMTKIRTISHISL